MTAWDDQGRPAEWVTETEPEFDVDERDSWQALREYDDVVCRHCGNLKSICSNPDGLLGQGFYPARDICWVTAARQAASRRFDRMHEKAEPDLLGYLPTDGVFIRAALVDEDPDDDFLNDATSDMSDLVARALAARDAATHTDPGQE